MATSTLTPEQRTERARKAGQASQAPEVLAARLVRDWPTLTADQRHTLRAMLRPITGRRA
ncbi:MULTISPECIES: hypothetical protein [unclassified Modestobacter]|uniref:hypothetical protein n=1 Tax=unclassified Modestobacter TaxID=2643866 RepID=UPI0022AAE7CB|nr:MULTISPECIES: hypothetical protein [unclassified Modestobacter]MCZ2824193.1 hypothetical protein [Modestobacter sp. VKM Ac-2981]MCZ2854279.1 hypothetical protein [Modestobacter sp. VKM Ac-2982]